ncbi:NACHT domain-containing protein [Flavobacterium branchiophilum]|uniref:Uncharacterized protein n=1 Tax=Flavobacterium branchiophilum TaxID=55197 RepID=A0A2H3KCH2_9FLAO|nr:NACHT domain-containing protein [Flavobacterium branchiophilum]PDS25047.1 hypothetical protein B0A77_06240 [Flavobacterium branchiophilum]
MEVNLEDIKTFTEISKPIIEPIINTLIKPHIEKLNKWIFKRNIEAKVEDNYWENKFSNYLEVIYKDSLYLTTLVFPNSQTKIKDLYVPLTLNQAITFERYKIDTFDYSIFDKYNKIIISDYAGMGKSTLLKWITISIIEQNKGIPILVELRKIDERNSLIDEIFNQINPIDNSFDKDLVFELLELGFFTILLDGFDEIPYDIQSNITIQISDFIKKVNKNNFVITSRPESALSTFADFQLFYIKPLEENEAYALIEKLDLLSKVKFGEKLIGEIKNKNTQVKEFLTNPFLVSLLYKSYTYNKDIPSKKITFYEEVYSCLFKHHDLSKEGFKRPKRSRLDIFDFEIILREIAYSTSKVGKVIYTKDEMLNYITSSKVKNSKIDFKEINFYDDLTTTVPIFNIEGSKIKWAHKSIQDFFSAKYISNHSRKEEIIEVLFKSNKFHYLNILDLLYELEPRIFRKIIIKKILEDYVSFYENQYPIKPEVSNEILDERIGLMYGAKFCMLKVENEIGFDKAQEIFANKIGKDENFNTGATFHHTQPPYYTMNEISLKKQLIKILRIKNEDLFQDKPKFQSQDIEVVLSKFEFDKPYVFDDNLNEPYNDKHCFSSLNREMASRLREMQERNIINFNLDYKKCKKLLEAINKEIISEESEDLLADI